MTSKTVLVASLVAPYAAAAAFQSQAPAQALGSSLKAASLGDDSRIIYDPFKLYPETSPERIDGRIRALEPRQVKAIKPVLDPMGIYSQGSSEVDERVDTSDALPFLPRPALLKRELAGDVGFDPLNLAGTAEKLAFMRVAELKHARIAMLAAVGWPASEALNRPLASLIHMKPLLLENGDRVPSLLNGGLGQVSPFYWMLVLGLAGGFEIASQINPESKKFDPLNIFPKEDPEGQRWWETAEIKNGRLAMMGIVGYVVEEFVTKTSLLQHIPFLSSGSHAAEVATNGAELLLRGFSA